MCFIDTATRYAFAEPMKSKSLAECLRAFKIILAKIPGKFQITRLDSDKEAAFRAHEFVELCQREGIAQHFYELDDHRGTAFVERFNRTLRELIERYKTAFNTNKWAPALPDLIYNYNNRVHSSLTVTPQQALDNPELLLQASIITDKKYQLALTESLHNQNLKPGDRVRLKITRKTFDKGTTARWTKGIHTILRHEKELYYVTDRVGGLKAYQLQKLDGVGYGPDSSSSPANSAQQEQQAHRAGRRQARAMNREGISAVPELGRQLRERRPVTLIEHPQFGRVRG